MNKKLLLCAVGLVGLVSAGAQAHHSFIFPSETIVGGEKPWVTFDLAVSDGIFHIDHTALRTEGITILAPDGTAEEAKNVNTGQLRSTFDLNVTQNGTYKIFVANSGLSARWETEDGKRGFWPERGAKANPEDFDKAVPKKAKNLEVSQTSRRVETFITKGKPSTQVFKPTNEGLEMVPVTHPNDAVVSQPSEFIFLIDGKPAVGAKVTVIASGTRYRNSAEETELETDKKGSVKVSWKAPGMYWLGASYRDEKAQKPAKIRSGNYSATFEVLPE